MGYALAKAVKTAQLIPEFIYQTELKKKLKK